MDKELIEALDGTTIEELHGDLWRYGGPEYDDDELCKKRFPEITIELVLTVIEHSGECPACLHRFIKCGTSHGKNCKLGPLLAYRGCKI